MSGGVTIGSEMSAGVRNVLAENCDFNQNINCLSIKSKDGRGGVVENIEYRNIHMHKGTNGVRITYRYSCEANDDPKIHGLNMPTVRNLYFENVTCDEVENGILIANASKCITIDTVNGLNFDNVNVKEVPSAGQSPRKAKNARIHIAPEYKA